jgi:hypothetical protein
MGGCDPDRPRTQSTSCAIPSWNVPKSIFGNRSRRKSVTKKSVTKSVTKNYAISVPVSLIKICHN